MNRKRIYTSIIVFLIFWSCFLYFKEHLSKIFHPNEYYLACTDFGQYIIELRDYMEDDKDYSELLKVSEDPGFFMIASNFLKITNVPIQSILTLSSMFMYCLVGFCLFLLSLQGSSRNKYLVGMIGVLLYVTLFWTIQSYISGIWRQIMGTVFFLVFLISQKYPNSRSYMIIGTISVVMAIMTHRIFLLVCSASLLFILLQWLFLSKKIHKKNICFVVIIVWLILPYFLLFSGYALHLFEYNQSLKLAWDQMRWYFALQGPSKYLWWSFFWPKDDNTALVHYLLYQGYIFIAFIAFWKKSIKKINKLYIFTLLFLLAYVSFRFDFSVRILLVFEIIMIPVIAQNIFFNYSRYINLFILVSISLLSFILLSPKVFKWSPVRPIDESISFLLNNIDRNERHYFLSTTCGADLLGQLDLTNFFNFQMPLLGMRQKKADNVPDVYELWGITRTSFIFLKRDKIMFDFFKDKGRLFIIFIKNDKVEVDLIKTGASDFLGKDYLHLIYPQHYSVPWSWIVQYIFEIDTEKIYFTDTKQYLQSNTLDFNLELDF